MKNQLPFYYRTWFISLLFFISPVTYYIPAIIAMNLLLQSRTEFPLLKKDEIEKEEKLVVEAEETLRKAKLDAERLLQVAKEEAESIVREAREQNSN
ncbi:hypothetical protein [Streptococcus sp. NLN64]|uniref:hypothetical protein n=1 Tax=Streptococcus sp. NLN64 TaxID=2822799 RepID=UPI0018CA35AE|nr:hypothetical protein [Streptococcus sp. NLN64]MBG9367627.1 hypothetical protein [Streptococcus sp. NLN64]